MRKILKKTKGYFLVFCLLWSYILFPLENVYATNSTSDIEGDDLYSEMQKAGIKTPKNVPANAFYYGGSYYAIYHADSINEALNYCDEVGGHLATLTTKEENENVYNYAANNGGEYAFFGFSDAKEEGKWEWVTGEESTYTNWHAGEPDSENSEEDYALFYFGDNSWNDGRMGKESAYICEWEIINQDFSKDINLLSGEWEGSYYGQQGKTALKLEITSIDENGNVEAVFNFSEHPDNQGVPNGKYTMTGTYNFLTKKINLMANEWINHPSGYLLLGIDADVDTEKLIISGKTGSYSGLYLTKSSGDITAEECIAIDQKANDLEGCTIALSGTLTLEESTEASEANLQAAINSLRFESSDDSKAKVLACDAVQNQNHRSATLEIWTTLYNKGTATITVTAADGHTSKCEITIAEDTSENNTSYEGDYSSEMRDFLLNKGTLNTLKYLCNDSNFTASTFVAEKDATFGNLLVMSLTDVYYRGWDGWKDLIDGSTSVEEAEKIIASLLGAYQGKVEGLSKAKTAQKYAKMVNNAFSDYTKATNLFTSLNSSEIEAARKYFSEDNIAKLLYEGKYDELTAPVNQILQQGTGTTEAWNELMEGFTQSAEMSKILKKGCQAKLGKLEVGGGLSDIGNALKLVSFAQDTLNYLYQLESLLTADEMYCEMLLYIQENCVYSVVQEAAGNLYSVINDGVAGIITDVSLKAINLGGEKILDVALDTACKSSLPFTIIKAGFDWGVTLSNTFFKTGSTQELKDSLRSQAFLANCLGRWVISNEMEYLSSIDTDMEAGKGKELYYSLYMLWESRKNAEETLQSLLKTTGANWSANYSVSTKVTSALESFQENIFTEENMGGLLGISVSCPVDVEVYNEGGTKLLTVKDGTECQGYEKGIYYYCIYNPLSDDYDKYIYYNEDANYNVEIIANDLGIADCSVSSVTNEGTISEFYFENMKINNGTVINLDGISREGVDYKVTNLNGGETSNSMDRRMADKISTASISLNTDLLELEVGERQLLTVSFAPVNATNQKVVWNSSNDAVVSVNNDGVVTAIKAGTAVVTVSQGDLEQTCKITVKEQNTQYKISYNLDGGNVTGNPTSYTADILPITLKKPTRNGYTFTGWTGSNGNTPQKTVMIAKGNTGNKSYTANWEKTLKDISKTTVVGGAIAGAKYVYCGEKIIVHIVLKDGKKTLREGTDYTLSYKNNVNVGTATVIIKGKGDYTGQKYAYFEIVRNTLPVPNKPITRKNVGAIGGSVDRVDTSKNGKASIRSVKN